MRRQKLKSPMAVCKPSFVHVMKFTHRATFGESLFTGEQCLTRKKRLTWIGLHKMLSRLGYAKPRIHGLEIFEIKRVR